MNSNIIIDSVLNNDFSGFKKSLYEDLQQKLLTNGEKIQQSKIFVSVH